MRGENAVRHALSAMARNGPQAVPAARRVIDWRFGENWVAGEREGASRNASSALSGDGFTLARWGSEETTKGSEHG